MSVCRVYLKGSSLFELHGKGFSVTCGRLEGDVRSIKWQELDVKKGDPLWFDPEAVAAVVVSDE